MQHGGWTASATCSPGARAPTPTRCRSTWAVTWTPQPTGGKYDGVLGVLGGLEIVRTLNDLGIRTKHPIVVTNWTNEEGTRFAPAMLASGVFAGVHEQAWAEDRTDAEGRRFGDELDRIGWRGEERGGRAQNARVFRAAYRTGPDP